MKKKKKKAKCISARMLRALKIDVCPSWEFFKPFLFNHPSQNFLKRTQGFSWMKKKVLILQKSFAFAPLRNVFQIPCWYWNRSSKFLPFWQFFCAYFDSWFERTKFKLKKNLSWFLYKVSLGSKNWGTLFDHLLLWLY